MTTLKRSRVGLALLAAMFGCAVYFHSWWLVMCGLFLFAGEYAAQEFKELKECMARIERKLDALGTSVSSTAP